MENKLPVAHSEACIWLTCPFSHCYWAGSCFHLPSMIKLYIAVQIQLTGLIMLQINMRASPVPPVTPVLHAWVCNFSLSLHTKTISLCLPCFSASQAEFREPWRGLLHGSRFSCPMQHIKMVLKQATQSALFRAVTFSVGWSRTWKNVWAKNAFPVIIQVLNGFVKSVVSCCCDLFVEAACLCEVHHGKVSLQFLVVRIEVWRELYFY